MFWGKPKDDKKKNWGGRKRKAAGKLLRSLPDPKGVTSRKSQTES